MVLRLRETAALLGTGPLATLPRSPNRSPPLDPNPPRQPAPGAQGCVLIQCFIWLNYFTICPATCRGLSQGELELWMLGSSEEPFSSGRRVRLGERSLFGGPLSLAKAFCWRAGLSPAASKAVQIKPKCRLRYSLTWLC